jgi:hypothetical protein
MSALARLLFPEQARHVPGERWINIGLRCAHLVGVAGSGAGLFFGVDPQRWSPFWLLAVATGAALVALYVGVSGRWLLQAKGLVISFKLSLLLLGLALPDWRPAIFVALIVISGLIAHAPAAVRNRQWVSGGSA